MYINSRIFCNGLSEHFINLIIITFTVFCLFENSCVLIKCSFNNASGDFCSML